RPGERARAIRITPERAAFGRLGQDARQGVGREAPARRITRRREGKLELREDAARRKIAETQERGRAAQRRARDGAYDVDDRLDRVGAERGARAPGARERPDLALVAAREIDALEHLVEQGSGLGAAREAVHLAC